MKKKKEKFPAWLRQIHAEEERTSERRNWARSLCQVLIFWHGRHPEAIGEDALERVKTALDYLDQGTYDRLSLHKDKRGFSLQAYGSYPHYQRQYYSITTDGLPEIDTSYQEETVPTANVFA